MSTTVVYTVVTPKGYCSDSQRSTAAGAALGCLQEALEACSPATQPLGLLQPNQRSEGAEQQPLNRQACYSLISELLLRGRTAAQTTRAELTRRFLASWMTGRSTSGSAMARAAAAASASTSSTCRLAPPARASLKASSFCIRTLHGQEHGGTVSVNVSVNGVRLPLGVHLFEVFQPLHAHAAG